MNFLGTVTVIANGLVLATLEGVEIQTAGYERSDVMANGRPMGYTQKPVAPYISCKVGVDADLDPDAINALTDGVVVARGDNGFAYQIEGARTSMPIKVGDNAGGGELRFTGNTGRKL